MSLTKIDITEAAYRHLHIPKKDCVHLVESVFDIIKTELATGNPVMISGFGKWTVSSKKARRGRNPQTGKEMRISARKVITFKGSNVLRNKLND